MRRLLAISVILTMALFAPAGAKDGAAPEREIIRGSLVIVGAKDGAAPEREIIRGSLVIVGGGLEPETDDIFQAFISRAMRYRNKAKRALTVGIVPAASGEPVKSAQRFRKSLAAYGIPAHRIKTIPVAVTDDESTRAVDESTWAANAADPALAKEILQYDAVWFVGGDQSRHTAALYGAERKVTPVLAAIRQIYAQGAVLGGTSAGAAIMSDPMIGDGESLDALDRGAIRAWGKDSRGVFITRGLGFFPYGLVDQHFNQRGRFGRLAVAARDTGCALAFGVDEDTAMIVDNVEHLITVAGRNGVTVIDLARAAVEGGGQRTTMRDLLVSYLEQGDRFRTDTGAVEPAPHDAGRPYEPDDIPAMNTSILFRIKEAATVCLVKEKSSWGIAFRLTSESGGDGYRLTFRRESDTDIWCGMRDGEARCHAVKVHVDITPITLQINR